MRGSPRGRADRPAVYWGRPPAPPGGSRETRPLDPSGVRCGIEKIEEEARCSDAIALPGTRRRRPRRADRDCETHDEVYHSPRLEGKARGVTTRCDAAAEWCRSPRSPGRGMRPPRPDRARYPWTPPVRRG